MELGTNNKKSKMADENEGKSSKSSHFVKKHHEKAKACYSRPRYRDPRWEKAVKVFVFRYFNVYKDAFDSVCTGANHFVYISLAFCLGVHY